MPFTGFSLRGFWDDSDYALKKLIERKPSAALIASVESELGYQLPTSYVWLMRRHNGGIPARTCFPTRTATSWAADHVAISSLAAIGRTQRGALCGNLGSRFMIAEWGYPDLGVVFADCPSAGHDVLMLDYRSCGPRGEPTVIHVDQARDYAVTPLAESFEAFIRGLRPEFDFQEDDDEVADAEYRKVIRGAFSPLLARLCDGARGIDDVAGVVRALAESIVDEKGHFSLHDDALSVLVYDVQLWLYAQAHPVFSREEFLKDYPSILVFGAEFSTRGDAPAFVTTWFDARVKSGKLLPTDGGLRLEAEEAASILRQIAAIER